MLEARALRRSESFSAPNSQGTVNIYCALRFYYKSVWSGETCIKTEVEKRQTHVML
jgi:hypothetical protein